MKFDKINLIERCSGQARDQILSKAWEATPMGPLANWSQDLMLTLANLLCSPVPALLFWGDQNLVFYNDAYLLSFVNRTLPEALGKPCAEVWPESWIEIQAHIRDAKLRGHAVGEGDIATYTYSPAFLSSGSIGGVFVMVEPIPMHLALNTADRARADFLANMSHEIRTPMTAILGFTEVLRDSSLTLSERADAITRIERSGRALLQLIDDILEISRAESGKVRVVRASFSPFQLVSEVMTLLRPAAEQKGLRFQMSFGEGVPLQACSDAPRLRQVLLNLVGNAIKFTIQGEIDVRVEAMENRFLSFDVRDTGIGISESDQLKLFRPLVQVDDSVTRRFGGTGVGLSLSRRICERLGGSLELVRSSPTHGSVFIAQIEASPFSYESEKVSTLEAEAAATGIELKGKKVLLVEDVIDNQDLMRFYLESAGVEVEIASDGEEAIQKALRKSYDLILMDIQMPRLDGLQAARILRQEGYHHPILALTAHCLSEDIERSLNAGFDEHLIKPITQKCLVSAVARHLG